MLLTRFCKRSWNFRPAGMAHLQLAVPVKLVRWVVSFKGWCLQAYGVPKPIPQPHLHFSNLLSVATSP